MFGIVSLSGGVDSATVLDLAIKECGRPNVRTFGFTYGSKHNMWENKAAVEIAKFYEVPHRRIWLDTAFDGLQSTLMQAGGAIPEGHYEAESMRQTVVPGRNLIFLSVLAAHAESWVKQVGNGAKAMIYLGVHAGDHFIYPDCRPNFIENARSVIMSSTEEKVIVTAPFLNFTKKTIIENGLTHKVPYHLTRTCYKAQPKACGVCGSCQERLMSFKELGVEDPIEYVTRKILPK